MSLTKEDILNRIKSNTKKPKVTTHYKKWAATVALNFPKAFIPALTPKRSAIFKNICAIVGREEDISQFFEWIVSNWHLMSTLTGIKDFDKYPYPEVTLLMAHYAVLYNLYKIRSDNVTVKKTIKRVSFNLDD